MPPVDVRRLTQRDALALLDAVEAQGPQRLAEFAHWVGSTDGPLDELDGSLESLIPLWVWFRRFARDSCPGIPRGAGGIRFVRTEAEAPAPLGCIAYAAESVVHYVLLVIRRVDPGAHWDIERSERDINFHSPGIRLANGALLRPERQLSAGTSDLHEERPVPHPSAQDGWLHGFITECLHYLELPAQPRQACVLPPPRPTPDPPPVLWRPTTPDPWFRDGWTVAAEERATRLDTLTGDGLESWLILDGDPADAARPDRAAALDDDLIVTHLRNHDFERRGSTWQRGGEGFRLTARLVRTGRAVRCLEIRLEGDVRAVRARALMDGFGELAGHLGAQITNGGGVAR